MFLLHIFGMLTVLSDNQSLWLSEQLNCAAYTAAPQPTWGKQLNVCNLCITLSICEVILTVSTARYIDSEEY